MRTHKIKRNRREFEIQKLILQVNQKNEQLWKFTEKVKLQ